MSEHGNPVANAMVQWLAAGAQGARRLDNL
jgi:hypothetical protein